MNNRCRRSRPEPLAESGAKYESGLHARRSRMPLCPRCGAANHRDLEVCKECGKRLLDRSQVAADQTSLSFPTCVDGPGGCEGPPSLGPDGELRCSAHHLATKLSVHRSPDPKVLACFDGPIGCRGPVTPRDDDQLRCDHHRELAEQPRWRGFLKRWFGRS